MSPHEAAAFTAIGRAVWMAQVFEATLVQLFEFFKMQQDLVYAQKTGGYVTPQAYKLAISNLIKALAAKGNIEPELEGKLLKYNEDRHTLVHRWYVQHGYPAEDAAVSWHQLQVHADSVGKQAESLVKYLVGYIVAYAQPDWAAKNPDEYRARMSHLFRQSEYSTGKGE